MTQVTAEPADALRLVIFQRIKKENVPSLAIAMPTLLVQVLAELSRCVDDTLLRQIGIAEDDIQNARDQLKYFHWESLDFVDDLTWPDDNLSTLVLVK